MKFFVGLLIGLGLGFVAGLLYAPQSGESTRALINEQWAQQSDRVRSGTFNEELRTRANEALSQGRELYSRTKGELSERYNQAKQGNL